MELTQGFVVGIAILVQLGGGIETYRVLTALMSPPSKMGRHSSPSSLPQHYQDKLSTGVQMRRWLMSLFMVTLLTGELALAIETFCLTTKVVVPFLIYTLLRFSPVRSPFVNIFMDWNVLLYLAFILVQAVVFVSAITSLVVYWATLCNSIAGPPFFMASKYWIYGNLTLYTLFAASLAFATFHENNLCVLLLLMIAYILACLALAYYGISLLRILPAIPSTSKRLINRLVPMVGLSLLDTLHT
jgi:hypothetical protein